MHLDDEAATSCLKMALALTFAARNDRRLAHAAAFVHELYVSALDAAPKAREIRWRRFVNALAAYLARCAPSPQYRWLGSIVDENADLLDPAKNACIL
jgi:hypothetical protein